MYPERQSSSGAEIQPTLEQYQGMHRQLERDIQDNNREIKLLNNKIVKYIKTHSEATTTTPYCKN